MLVYLSQFFEFYEHGARLKAQSCQRLSEEQELKELKDGTGIESSVAISTEQQSHIGWMFLCHTSSVPTEGKNGYQQSQKSQKL